MAVGAKPQITSDFLADLDLVYPKAGDCGLSAAFIQDLQLVHQFALATSPQEPTEDLLSSLESDLKEWRGYHQRLLQNYLARLPHDDPLLCPVSLFGTMDYGRLETAHTRALAWLLGDREHGFGHRLLEALMLHLLKQRPIHLAHVKRVESEVLVQCGPEFEDTGRIDVLAEGTWMEHKEEVSWQLVIEAKIDASEGEEQLSLYDEWIKLGSNHIEVLRIFLTPDGRRPLTGLKEWQSLSFLDLASVFRRVSFGLQDTPGYHFLRYYLAGVLRDVCGLTGLISSDCPNPYAAVDYLRAVLGLVGAEGGHDQPR